MDKITFSGISINSYRASNTPLQGRKQLVTNLIEGISNKIGGKILKDDTFSVSNEGFEAEAYDVVKKPILSFFGKAKSALKVFVVHDKKGSSVDMIAVSKNELDAIVDEVHHDAFLYYAPFEILEDKNIAASGIRINKSIKDDISFVSEIKQLKQSIKETISK